MGASVLAYGSDIVMGCCVDDNGLKMAMVEKLCWTYGHAVEIHTLCMYTSDRNLGTVTSETCASQTNKDLDCPVISLPGSTLPGGSTSAQIKNK